MKYPKMEWGKMEAIINKLGGKEGVKNLFAGKLFLADTARLEITYMTIKTGEDFETFEEMAASLKPR